MSYTSRDSQLAARQLEAQEAIATANLVAGTSDLASNIAINNSTLTATVITFTASEDIKSCFCIQVTNRATGAIVATTAIPDVSVAQKASVTVDGTALTSVVIKVVYSVAQ